MLVSNDRYSIEKYVLEKATITPLAFSGILVSVDRLLV